MKKRWVFVRGIVKFLVLFTIAIMVAPLSMMLLAPSEKNTVKAANGNIVVEVETQISGINNVQGGGYITWSLYGNAASDLRNKVITRYDGLVKPGSNPPEIHKDGVLQDYEVTQWIGNNKDVEATLLGYCRAGWTIGGVRIQGFQPLTSKDDPISQEDCAGLIGTSTTSTDNIVIKWMFQALPTVSNGNYKLQDQKLIWGFYAPLNIKSSDDFANETINKNDVQYKTTEYILGLQSISNPNIGSGSLLMVRAIIAEASWYDYSGATPEPANSATFSNFIFLESPVVLFVFVFIVTEVNFSIVDRVYSKFREKAMDKTDDRKSYKKVLWLHLAIYLFFILLWVFYFFPGLSFVFIGGLFMWVYGILVCVVSCVISKIVYDKKLTTIKEVPIIPQQIYQPPAQPAPIHLHVTVTQSKGQNGQAPPQIHVAIQPPDQPQQLPPQTDQPVQAQDSVPALPAPQPLPANPPPPQPPQQPVPVPAPVPPPATQSEVAEPTSPEQPTKKGRPKKKQQKEDEDPLTYEPIRPPGF